MSKRDWKLLASDIFESIQKIEKFIFGFSYEDFLSDEKTKDAVVRNLEIIGEASKSVPENIRLKYQEIPWEKIIGLRNRLIHGYFAIEYRIIWEIVTKDLPQLKIQIQKLLEEEK